MPLEQLTACVAAQKLAVRSCPVVAAASKPPSLIKPPSQAVAISAVPTAHLNGQKIPAAPEPQTGCGVALGVGGHPPGARTTPDLPPTQVTGSPGAIWGRCVNFAERPVHFRAAAGQFSTGHQCAGQPAWSNE